MDDKITYGKMCEVIADDWNREQRIIKGSKDEHDLIGLLLTNEACAKMFFKAIAQKESK